MCGITGIVSSEGLARDDLHMLETMTSTLSHRGPDGDGFWHSGFAALGHRRLSIIDLSDHGRQPMVNEDGSLVLVCNGEIYNFRELRSDLIRRNHQFASETDVEVVLHLYEELGPRCLEHLVGMFAFAIWDAGKNQLFFARDRIGEKPLYYAHSGASCYFASEIKALRCAGFGRRINEQAAALMALYYTPPAPLTFFNDIHLLPAATYGLWSRGQVSLTSYWHIDFSRREAPKTLRAAADRFADLMQTSVNGCCNSDVPLGVMLSGGIDSSIVSLHASRISQHLQSFCIGNPQNGNADPEFIRASRVAALLGTQHTNIAFNALNIASLPAIIRYYDQPVNLFAILYAHQIAQDIRQHVKVVLTGNGADEIFGGYSGYIKALASNLAWPLMRAIPRGLLSGVSKLFRTNIERFSRAAGMPLVERRGWLLVEACRPIVQKLMTKQYQTIFNSCEPARFINERSFECSPRSFIDSMTYTDLMVYHQHSTTILPDVSGMAHGLEMRSPFLDHRIIEFAAALPWSFKVPSIFNAVRNKAILKKSLEPYIDRSLIYARKMGYGYGISYQNLLKTKWKHSVTRWVLKGAYRDLGVFSDTGIAWAIENSPAHVWMLLVFSLWAELYLFHADPTSLALQITESLSCVDGQ